MAPGDRAFWFNTVSLESRPVTIVRVQKARYVVRTDDGHIYTPPKGYVQRAARRAIGAD